MKRSIRSAFLCVCLSMLSMTMGCTNTLPGDVSEDGTLNTSETMIDSFSSDPVKPLTPSPEIQITSTSTPNLVTPTSTPNLVTPTDDDDLPDLALGRLWIQLENPAECPLGSTELGVEVDVVNESEVDAGPFSVEVDEKVIRVENGLSAGEMMKLWFAGHSSYGLTTAMVDVYDEVLESDENNNGRSQQLAIPTLPPPCPPTATATPTPLPPDTSQPDLIITWVWFDLNTGGSCTLPESEVGLRVYISNIGNADASAFSVKLNDEFQRVEEGLAEGKKTTLWFYQYAVPGSFSHAVVDVYYEVQEIDEGNNEFEVQLPALTPALPCTATPTNTPGPPTPTITPTWTPSP